MDTCLFTGARLDEDTRVEHTIPESLGGRVETRKVTSAEFNERWGSLIVSALKAPYASIMNRLGPLLPEAHKTRLIRIDVSGEAPGLALDDDGVLTRDGLQIIARDPVTNRPRSIVGSNERAIRRILKQAGARDDQITLSYVPATTANVYTSRVPVIWADIELAALTATLLTFDELTRDRPNRFTRSDAFAPVRDFVAKVVQDGRFSDGAALNRFSLGLQYENLQRYREIRERVPHPRSSFEHVLIASGDAGARVVDLIWAVLGFDPLGFRIDNWRGGDFTYAFVNGILRGTSCSDLVELRPEGLLCRPTDRRAFPARLLDLGRQSEVMDEVSARRRAAWEEAVYLVEMSADDFIVDNMRLAGDLMGGSPSVRSIVAHRLRRMYGRRFDDAGFEAEVEGLIDSSLPALPSNVSSQVFVPEPGESEVDWVAWLAFYRSCLDSLVASHGKPGDTFVASSGVIVDSVDARELGREPAP